MRTDGATTYGAALQAARTALRDVGIESAALDARLLMADAAGLGMASLLSRGGDLLPALAAERFDAHLKLRLGGAPVARILGRKEFWGLDFALSEATLVPRPETETLVGAVLAEARRRFPPTLTICDLGAGSGAILMALLTELPQARGMATDISAAALATARLNAEKLGLLTRISFHHGDFARGPDGPFDIVVSNPPYVASAAIAGLAPEVRDHDPRIGLNGGPDGLAAYRAIIARAGELLAPGGLLAFEVGYDQSEAVAELCRGHGLSDVAVRPDLAGHARVVTAEGNMSESRRNGAKIALGKLEISG